MPASTPKLSWARDGADTDVTQPNVGVAATGYQAGDIPTHGDYNWLQAHRAMLFLDSHEAAEVLKEGQMAQVPSVFADVGPGQRSSVTYSGGTATVWTTGRWVLTQNSSGSEVYVLRSNDLSLVRTISTGLTGAAIGCIDGQRVIVFDGSTVKSFTYDGATEWSAAVAYTPVHSDGQRVYMRNGNSLEAYTADSGSSDYTYDHNAAVYSAYSDGRRLWLVGAASGSASGATMRCIEAASGADFAGEGGIATSSADYVWDAVPSGLVISASLHWLAYDGDSLYVNGDISGAVELFRIDPWDGSVIDSVARSNAAMFVQVDTRFVYCVDPVDARVDVYTKDLRLAWRYVPGSGAANIDHFAVCPSALYMQEDPSSSDQVTRCSLPGAGMYMTQVYRRDEVEDAYAVWPNLVVHPLL